MQLLADTQVLIWYVTDPSRLSTAAGDAIQASIDRDEPVGAGAFSIVELAYATEKTRSVVTPEQYEAAMAVLQDAESPFEVLPLDSAVSQRVVYPLASSARVLVSPVDKTCGNGDHQRR